MYEEYIGKHIAAILVDDRRVEGIVEEVLDTTGSLKLANVLIFKSLNDPPREVGSFTIPGNRLTSVSSKAPEVAENTGVSEAASPVANTKPSTIAPESPAPNKQLDILQLFTANRSPSESAISSQLLAKSTPPPIASTDDVSVATPEPEISTTKASPSKEKGIPNKKLSFMFQTPKKNRNFVDTVEMEYDDLLDRSKSPATKSKATPKAVREALSEDKTDGLSTASSVDSLGSQNVIEAKVNTPHSNRSSPTNSVTQSPIVHHPKVDKNATNTLLANLNIGKPLANAPSRKAIQSGTSSPNSNVDNAAFDTASPTPQAITPNLVAESPKPTASVQPALKKAPSYAIPAGLIPPKARRRESQESSNRQTEEKHQSLPTAPVTSSANGKNKSSIADNFEHSNSQSNIRTVSEGHVCPLVTPMSMKTVYTICDEETGPNTAMITESAGVSAAMMALKAIGGQRRIQPNNHNAAPLIVVLAGNNNHVGSYGLTAARHLLNRGCQVIVCIAANANTCISQRITNQEYLVQLAGGQVVRCVEDLPQKLTTPVDIIIDALLGSQTTLADLRADREAFHIVTTAMDWANDNKAPVLSLNFPSGIDPLQGNIKDIPYHLQYAWTCCVLRFLQPITGTPYHVGHRIKPKWTLCYGAPICGCSSRNVTGELFLADIGIPKSAWKKANVHPTVPFGSDIIIALEYF
ncbi:hypothetical protein INT43_002764 [Umbelopsis isabellina]|uniref:YjeF N-terminal domain-containing protein n=1 Tax=Mortierella isabellina TaxID=91625 RepID=A0A8H7Q5S4_MORIS|nr:hypothetical protein INT43_002764 [Umbelopsis isabellina]